MAMNALVNSFCHNQQKSGNERVKNMLHETKTLQSNSQDCNQIYVNITAQYVRNLKLL